MLLMNFLNKNSSYKKYNKMSDFCIYKNGCDIITMSDDSDHPFLHFGKLIIADNA